MTAWIAVAIAYFTLFIYIWVKGLGIVKERQPDGMVRFYFLAVTIRFIVGLTIVALYLLFNHHTRGEAVAFCTAFSLMYVLAIVVSVALRH